MAGADETLAIELVAIDEMSDVVKSAAAEVTNAAQEMAAETAASGPAAANVGVVFEDAMAKAEVAVQNMNARLGELQATTVKTGDVAQESFKKTDEEVTRSGRGIDGFSRKGGSALSFLAAKVGTLQTGFRHMRGGVELAEGSTLKMTKAVGELSTKLLQAATSGNYLSAVVLLGATAFGYFTRKADDATKATEKALADNLKVTEKIASEATKIEEKAVNETLKIKREVGDAELSLAVEQAIARGSLITESEAKERERNKRAIEDLKARYAEEYQVWLRAESAKGEAKSPEASASAGAASESAKRAMTETQTQMALENQLHSLREAEVKTKRIADNEAESLRIRKDSISTLNRIWEAGQKYERSVAEEIRLKFRVLELDEKKRKYANEIFKIQELHNQGLHTQATLLDQALRITVAREQLEKDRDALKERIADQEKLNLAAGKEIRERENLQKATVGLTDNQAKVLEKIYDAYNDINEKIKEGLSVKQAELLYASRKKEILDEEHKRIKELTEKYKEQTRQLQDQLTTAQRRSDFEERMASAVSSNAQSAIMRMHSANIKEQERVEIMQLQQQYQREIYEAAKEGDGARVEALQKQYELERQILETKREQKTVQEEIREALNAAGVSVGSSRSGGTRTNYGIQDRRDARRRELRERNLKSERAGRGAFGMPEGATNGLMFGTFGQAGAGAAWGGGKKKDTWKSLGGVIAPPDYKNPDHGDGPPGPVLPQGVDGPKLASESGDANLKAQLAETEAKLTKFAEQQKTFAESIDAQKKSFEDMVDVGSKIADNTKKAADDSAKLAKSVDDTGKAATRLADKVVEMATKSADSTKTLIDKVDDATKKIDDFIKQLDDAKKAGD